MARLLLISIQKTILPYPGVAVFVVLLGVISVFSIVGFLCGSHGGLKRSNTYKREKNTVHLGDKKPRKISKLGCGLSSKALLMTKMISWKKVDECDDQDVGDDQEAVWKRTIIMGERCRPLEFSGKILYDENGNPMPESPRKHVASADNVVGLQKS
nr:WD repeat-containing protein [Tanacetum cinerariifolium]